jgi:hypothetical protein
MHGNHPQIVTVALANGTLAAGGVGGEIGMAAHHTQPEPRFTLLPAAGWIGRPGGHGGEPTPDPIPNSAVKFPSAHGTVS